MFARRTAAAAPLVLVAGLLGACGDDKAAPETGDVIPARVADQFENGAKSVITVPVGRLIIRVGEPKDSLETDDTRELSALDAPAGATFVPLMWQYDPGAFDGVFDYVAADADPIVDLHADGQDYRLPSPVHLSDDGESFWVVVDGDATDLSLDVEFDGETQTVDLATGKRTGSSVAGPLYHLSDYRIDKVECPQADYKSKPQGVPDDRCKLGEVIRLPYADGRWAEPGRVFVGLPVTTSLRRYQVTLTTGGGIYLGTKVRSKLRLAGEKPAMEVPSTKDLEQCPVLMTLECAYGALLVFEVDDDAELDLEITQQYKLVIGPEWGDYDEGSRLNAESRIEASLEPKDKDKGKKKRGSDEESDES